MGLISNLTKNIKLTYLGLISPIILGTISIIITLSIVILLWSISKDIRYIGEKTLQNVKDNSLLAKELLNHHQKILKLITWSSNGVTGKKLEELDKEIILSRASLAISLMNWNKIQKDNNPKIHYLIKNYLASIKDTQEIGYIDGAMGTMLMNSTDDFFQKLSNLILSDNIRNLEYSKKAAQQKTLETEKTALFFLFFIISLTAISLIISAVIMKSLSNSLMKMYHTMLKVSKGDVDTKIIGCDYTNEIGDIARALNIFSESMRELSEAKDRMKQIALTDSLTQIPNRRGLKEELKPYSDDGFLNSDKQISLFHIDLDGFKLVNDKYGHAAGDHILIEATNILQKNISKDDILARVGGDEFVYIKIGNFTKAELEFFGYEFVQNLSKPIKYEGKELKIGASIGVSTYTPGTILTYERLLANADIALYEVKRNGKSAALFYEDELKITINRTCNMLDELKIAIKRSEFTPYFEPLLNITDDSLIAFKVQTRWLHPTKGELTPSAFFEKANQHNIMHVIDEQVIDKAIEVLHKWESSDYHIPMLIVHIGGEYFYNSQLSNNLIAKLDKYNIAPEKLMLNIHKSILENVKTDKTIDKKISELHKLGFPIELGTDTTTCESIKSLQENSFQYINIDCQFMNALHTHVELHQISKTMIDILRGTGLQIIAKNVENKRQKAILAKIGCNIIQGQLIGSPIHENEVSNWMENYHTQKANLKTEENGTRNKIILSAK